MKYSLVIKEEAKEDIQTAYHWYEDKLIGLGDRFLDTLENCLKDISSNPFLFEKKYTNLHFGFMDTFPYVAIYEIEQHSVIVYAVFNTHRNPKIWKHK